MQISIHRGDPGTAAVDLMALGVWAGDPKKSSVFKILDRALGGALAASAKEQEFGGKPGQVLVLHTLKKLRARRVALVGLGEPGALDNAALLTAGALAARRANAVGAKTLLYVQPGPIAAPEEAVAQLARGAMLACYRYTEYKSDKGRPASLTKLKLHLPVKSVAGLAAAGRRATAMAEGACAARDLINRSPLQLYPESFAAEAVKVVRQQRLQQRLKVKVIAPAALERMKMNLLLGVGAGSTRKPRLVHLTYTPPGGRKTAKPIVLVGKGITFDSGGLSLKPPTSMIDMKVDMGGAATVFGAMLAIAKLAPKTPVHGILVLAENMPGGGAIRPGDVITAASGKTVEIINTDAEGRLVLADALHYARKLKPKLTIDVATLTGACVVALGPHTVGLFANQDELADALLTSAKRVGEDFWRLPLTEALDGQLKSDVADCKNTGERWGGAITAALFLRKFAPKGGWMHLDIAGPVTSNKEAGAYPKGATGVAVATLVDLITGG